MTKQNYLNCCYQQLFEIFQRASQHKKDDKQKFRAEGFIKAGKMLGVISHKEAAAMMEKAHFDVFGESIETHRNRKISLYPNHLEMTVILIFWPTYVLSLNQNHKHKHKY